MGKKSLKGKNTPTLLLFMLVNFALFIVLLNGTENILENLQDKVLSLKDEKSLFSIIAPILVGIFSGIIPTNLKRVLFFGRFKIHYLVVAHFLILHIMIQG